MAASGSKPPSNLGCVIAIIALPIVILIGVVLGTMLRGDESSDEEEHITLEEGETAGTAWRVDAVKDVDGATCTFLYEGDAEDPLNGTCDLQPQDVTYGDQTVVFGRVQSGSMASVELSNDEIVDAETQAAEGMEGRFYVVVVDGDVDAVDLSG